MNKNNQLASTVEMDKRKEKAQEFYNGILDPYEHPWLVTDEASLYDITLDQDEDLISRIDSYYGVKLEKIQLGMPFWRLLDYIDVNRSRL